MFNINPKQDGIKPLYTSVQSPFRDVIFVEFISCTTDRIPGLKEVRSAEGDILIQNVPVVNPVNEKVKKGMDILIRSGKISKIQPTGKEKFKNIALVIPGEELQNTWVASVRYYL